jgi:large subunit ribosomal protein L9
MQAGSKFRTRRGKTMKVILLENVYKLGQTGDVVDVKPGYARNFLLARKMAQALSKDALAQIEELKRVALRRADRDLAAARLLASRLQDHVVKLEGKPGARGSKLYGSVTSQSIATAVGTFLEMEIDKRRISLPEPIKTLGMHKYTIKLHPEVEVEGRVEVVKKPEAE